jgi:hypothetical protein
MEAVKTVLLKSANRKMLVGAARSFSASAANNAVSLKNQNMKRTVLLKFSETKKN